MSPPRLAHETLPPTPPINNFTRITPPVGMGALSSKNQKIGYGARRWLGAKFVQHSGYQLCRHMEPAYFQLEFDLRACLCHLAAGGLPLWGTAAVDPLPGH